MPEKKYDGPKKEFKPVPEGEYLVSLVKAEEKATKNGKGVAINYQAEIIKGEQKGNKVFGNFLVEHSSPKAQEIGNKMLNYYLEAVGVEGGMESLGHDRTQIQDNLMIPFVAKVIIEDPQEYTVNGVTKTSKARNKIVSFKAR